MDPIYVTGHRNPDTDSIVSAMAYTALRNALGDREYEAACLGHVSDETQLVLNRFGFQPPKRIFNMYTQVKDLAYETPPVLSAGVTVGRAWTVLQSNKNVSSVAVANEDGTLYGMLSLDDVASFHMGLVSSAYLRPVPVFNLLSVLEGKLINDPGVNSDMVWGEVTIALPQSRENLLFHHKESIVVCGNQPDMIQRALELNVNCLILCQAEVTDALRNIESTTNVIVTPYDAYRALRLIFQSAPVSRVCQKRDLTCFHLEDRVDDVREQVLKHHAHCYPILDSDERVVGILTRQHLLRPRIGGSGDLGDHRPPPPCGHPDRQPHLCTQRAGGLHQHHHCRYVPGAWTDALGEDGGDDGGGHRFRHRHVQVPHLHREGPPDGRASGPHCQCISR